MPAEHGAFNAAFSPVGDRAQDRSELISLALGDLQPCLRIGKLARRRVVLARRRDATSALGGPPQVHAYRVPDETSSATTRTVDASGDAPGEVNRVSGSGDPVVWVAVCGDRITRDDTEIVGRFTGAPCMTCFMSAVLASDVPSKSRAEAEGMPPAPQSLAKPAAQDLGVTAARRSIRFAPSWRECVVHLAYSDATQADYEGRKVVLGFCGQIGWGPDEHPPEGWESCEECHAIANTKKGES
ncbi:hypothetical protein [Saccharopolyspora phatthalungensis]|uniref:DUF3039 domain-containing protein n=1 Tax=Saccharopolyspora phatthalungensis TaxID=664693 RepID=A0A840QAU8_9PSEU|nr:hypothetical protein [Saccharopolyspora phatthalungensis]MBB5159662.1 hypothetical protein [Saccharopolyspora phatthalungensis]